MKYDDLQPNDIRLFVAVAESGSLVTAAALLDLPDSSASRALQRVEVWTGQSLFDRSTNRLKLTPEGFTFLLSARQMLATQDKLVARLRSQVNGRLTGRLNILALHDFGCAHIAPCIAGFLALNPEVDIMLALFGSRVDLLKDKADLIVCVGGDGGDDLTKRVLATEHVMLCASPSYLTANGHPEKIEDLSFHRLLTVSSADQSMDLVLPCRDRTHKIAGNIQLRSNDPEVLLTAATQGVGIAHIRASFIARELETGTLVAVLPNLDLLPENINAIYDPDGAQSHKVQAFLDFLIDRMKAG